MGIFHVFHPPVIKSWLEFIIEQTMADFIGFPMFDFENGNQK